MTSPNSPIPENPYLGASDNHLDLTTGGAHELAELGADTREKGQAVVLGEGGEEVLDGLAGGAGVLLQLGDDSALVGGGERRGLEDSHELRILLNDIAESGEALGGGLEGGGLDGGRVLFKRQNDAG